MEVPPLARAQAGCCLAIRLVRVLGRNGERITSAAGEREPVLSRNEIARFHAKNGTNGVLSASTWTFVRALVNRAAGDKSWQLGTLRSLWIAVSTPAGRTYGGDKTRFRWTRSCTRSLPRVGGITADPRGTWDRRINRCRNVVGTLRVPSGTAHGVCLLH